MSRKVWEHEFNDRAPVPPIRGTVDDLTFQPHVKTNIPTRSNERELV